MTYKICVLIAICTFISCGTSQYVGDGKSIKDPVNMTLVDHIQSAPGVIVNGDGANATIRVRGLANSMTGPSAPLFMIDGIDMGQDFSIVYYTVSANSIKNVRVLKEPSETAIYGVRGANGVVVIKTKEAEGKPSNY